MDKAFQTASIIESISTRKDNTLKIILGTQELSAEQKAQLMDLHNKIGWMLFKESEIQVTDIPEETPEFANSKSDSQRLRNVLYVYWEKGNQGGRIKKTFEEFKHDWYSKKIQQIKESIDEL